MKKHVLYFVRGGIFAVILFLALSGINRMAVPKYLNSDFPTSSNFLGFYEMEENSIDVLFLGSSHTMSAFSPQEIYDQFGLRSYNLGSQEQSPFLSYYWLREALRFQKPKAVVLDTYLCYDFSEEPLNSSEVTVRRALDHMRWSRVKAEAIADICAQDENQSVSSYYFPNVRYHNRWLNDMKEVDFLLSEWGAFYQMKGYALVTRYPGNMEFEPFEAGSVARKTWMLPLMREYMDKIVALCRENQIELLLVKTPTTAGTVQKFNAMSDYAKQNQLQYLDFNEKTLYEEIGYDFQTDNREWSHVNHWGAVKLCRKLGEVLVKEYHVPAVRDQQWEDSRPFYLDMVQNAKMQYIDRVNIYLAALQEDRYTIFLAVRGDAAEAYNRNIENGMERLGLQTSLSGKTDWSYYAVISAGGVREELSKEALNANGSFRDGLGVYEISSAGTDSGDSCSILLDGTEYARNRRGLNIVVYDNSCKKVIDSVCFDLHDKELTANR